MELLLWIIIFCVSLGVLIKASDYFILSGESIGLKLNISKFVIGATIMALGTSLPELASSLVAVFNNSSEIVAGNVIGSNIANILLILGISGLLYKEIHTSDKVVNVDLPVLLLSALVLALVSADGTFTRFDALLFIACMIAYLFYMSTYKNPIDEIDLEESDFSWKTPIILGLSVLFVYIGANYTVESIVKIATLLNVGTEIIAVTVVAVGTSLPELAVSLAALKKNKPDMMLGNIIGSNIYNTFGIMGLSGIFKGLVIPLSVYNYAIPVMCIASLSFLFLIFDKRINRKESIVFLSFYVLFILGLFWE